MTHSQCRLRPRGPLIIFTSSLCLSTSFPHTLLRISEVPPHPLPAAASVVVAFQEKKSDY